MKLAIATDHAGFELKNELIEHLQKLGHEVQDFGANKLDPADDYPDFMIPAAQSVANGNSDRAILVCTNGIGACILANKVKGVKGATLYSETSAKKTREDHDSNVACIAGKEFSFEDICRFLDVWLRVEYEGGRHERRMKKVLSLENDDD